MGDTLSAATIAKGRAAILAAFPIGEWVPARAAIKVMLAAFPGRSRTACRHIWKAVVRSLGPHDRDGNSYRWPATPKGRTARPVPGQGLLFDGAK